MTRPKVRNRRDSSLDMLDTIGQYICEELLEDDEPLDGDENLLADGMVDSLGMLRLVGFIDDTFDIVIPPEDFVLENFRTLNQLMVYLNKRSPGETRVDA